MDTRRSRSSIFAALLLLARLTFASAIVVERQDVNLTSLPNAASIVDGLEYTSNCTTAALWFNNLPANGTAGRGSNSINIAFLRSSLPLQYQNSSDAEIAAFYDDMSSGPLSSLAWLGTAIDDVETACIAPQFEKQVSLSQLNATQNCTATAEFLSSLGWISAPQTFNPNTSSNDSFWIDFIYYALPPAVQDNITDVELYVYYDHILSSESDSAINAFLNSSFHLCQNDICEVQGYTGNPDIGGIGVLASYTAEAALVTLYFAAVNYENFQYGIRPAPQANPSRFSKAFKKASDELLDGALFFSLSISSAGWVSFHSGRSYYEKLVFTSANILALSALLAFLAMFPGQGIDKRGYILVILILGILAESGVQYIVYLTENNAKYSDYNCLHTRFESQGYHPNVFEALFFLLVGLSFIGGATALWYKLSHKQELKEREQYHKELTTRERWVFGARIFVEVVAIAVVWVECVYLYKIRHIMAQIAGASWSEGQWGFGQILALFIWFPPLLDISGTLLLPKAWTGKVDTVEICGAGGKIDEKNGTTHGAAPLTEKGITVTTAPEASDSHT